MLLKKTILFFLIGALSAGGMAYGQRLPADSVPSPTSSEVEPVNGTIVVDGRLDEAGWQDAKTVSLDYEISPEVNVEPPVNTVCYFTYDSTHIYIGFVALDPSPDRIRAQLMDRDEVEKLRRDDHVGFMIDTFDNGRWAFQFRINALGVQADALFTDQTGDSNYSWDTIWESEGSITGSGYQVEVRIPLSSLNLPDRSPQTWRFNAYRSYPRDVRHEIQSIRENLNEQSKLAQLERITGIRNLSSGLNLEVNPVITSEKNDRRPAGGAALDPGRVSLDPGAYIRWGVKPNLNLSATLNPDFSQIEADALRLRQNERFVLSFPEKRPFFLRGSEIFETPMEAVFTRTIVDPDAGLKFTGKEGSHSFGAIVTRDRKNRMLFPSNQGSSQRILDQHLYSEILRYENQFSPSMAIGLLGAARQAQDSPYHNYVGGLDGFYRFWNANTVRFQYLRSNTRYAEGVAPIFGQPQEAFSGDAFSFNFTHSSRNWTGTAGFETVSSGFRNDSGFFPRADFRTYEAGLQRTFRGSSDHWFSRIDMGSRFSRTTDLAGRLTDQEFDISAGYSGPLQSTVFASVDWNRQRFGGQLFTGLRSQHIFFRIQPGGPVSKLRLFISDGEEVDFINTRTADELIVHPGITLNLGRRINLELDPNFQRLSRDGETVFNTYLLDTRLIYHFNKELFIRAITQYRYVERNLDQFNNPGAFSEDDESFFYQLLFSYKINPQSKFFLGYSSGYDDSTNNRFRIRNRTGFLKVGYVWVF